jgi:nucleoporin GLE1
MNEQNESKRMKERNIQHGRLHQYQVAYQTICEEIAKATEQCKDEQEFVAKVSAHTAKLNILKGAMNQLITRCKPASGIMQQLQEVLGVMHEESEKTNEQLYKRAVKGISAIEVQKTQALTGEGELNDVCETESFNLYMSLQQHLKNVEDFYKNFKEDDSLKNLRFECQKRVNICVNALCAGNADRLKDTLFRMSRLIAGQHMEFGHGQVLASSRPEAVAFRRNLLAKKFICQGAFIATTKPKLMFAYGAVIEALWADFPDFGQLVLANFHRECPYLVPIFMP